MPITADDIAAMITGGKVVKVDTAYNYVLPAASTSDSEISLNDAYIKWQKS